MKQVTAMLVLADGTVFKGVSLGVDGYRLGEVVFNTAMTGYQEILTDPSYAQQLVTLTYPHIGNVGCNEEDAEAQKVWAEGLIVRDMPRVHSCWRSDTDLGSYLKQNNVVAISEVDTRALTRILREKGAQSACLVASSDGKFDVDSALDKAQTFPGLKGADLAKEVSCKQPYEWHEGVWSLDKAHLSLSPDQAKFHVVALDFGVKQNILRLLVEQGCRVTVLPAQSSASDILSYNPDGVFLSNGPGDPEPCTYAIEAIRQLLEKAVPIFGICLGHQLLALASGARTEKMKFGHHGANHPVLCHETKQVWITSQNHGFAVCSEGLPDTLRLTHSSLFDHSIQGIRRVDVPAFSFQGHPEASPGPHDPQSLFKQFADLMSESRRSK